MPNNSFSLDAITDVYTFSSNWTRIRLTGPVSSYYQFWFQIKTPSGRLIPIQKLCLDWDHEAQEFIRAICPYRKAGLTGQTNYISNGIVRSMQDQLKVVPAHSQYKRRTGNVAGYKVWKVPASQPWTPVRVMRITPGLAARIKSACEDCGHDLADPKHGRDISIRYDKRERAYGLRVGERTALTQEELSYRRYSLDIEPEPLDDAIEEWGRLQRLLLDRGSR